MAARKLFYSRGLHLFSIGILLSSLLLSLSFLLFNHGNAAATISACTASISPTQLYKNSDTDVTITINNTDSNTVSWIKIQVPNPSMYTMGDITASGWSIESNDTQTVILTGGTISPSSSQNVTINVATEDFTDPSSAWTVQVSDDGGGASPFSCSGSLGTAVISADNQAPSISSLTISDITSSSVKITWTTDTSSTSVVDYGTTSSYGSTKSDTSMTTSHTINIDSLSANTTYHFNAKSTNSGSVTGESGDQTFTTAKAGLTSDPITITTTTTVTATPTPTPVPDRIPPAVSIDTNLSKSFLKPPTITGKASDASGILRIQYSVDDGKNWNNVDEIPNLGARFVTFTFTPPPLDDDNYKIRIRATDNAPAQNVKTTEPTLLIIDRLPPLLIGNIISIGPQILFPTNDGYLLTTKKIKQKITITAVGGPTEIDLYAYPVGAASNAARASESATIYHLSRNPDNGLWSALLEFTDTGMYELASKSTDGAGNITEQKLNTIAVLTPGKVLSNKKPVKDAKATLYYFEEKYQIWRIWDGNSYDQQNPQKTNENGEFSYFLPSGRYYFAIQAGGYQQAISEIFLVENPTIINPVFELKPLTLLLDLWLFKIYLPDFSVATAPVTIATTDLPNMSDTLIGKTAPSIELTTTDAERFDLFSTRRTPVILTFLNLLSPLASEQIAALDTLTEDNFQAYTVMIGNTTSKINAFKKAGGYKTTFIADPDATTVEDYKLHTLPTHYFIDRRGVITNIVTGIRNKQELENILLQIQ